jgi:hypothetical protein
MGQVPPRPGDPPAIFALDIVSTHRFQHGTIAFSPAGNEAIWSSQIALQETGYSEGLMLTSRIVDGRWSEPAAASFSRLAWNDDVPIYSHDGNRLYFLSTRLADGEEEGRGERIWYVERAGDGWSEPRLIEGGPNTLELHWSFSVAEDETLYIPSRGDLYVSRFANGRWEDPVSLGAPLNSASDEGMPSISRDGSYLVFTRFGHPENIGFADLWISFRTEDAAGPAPGAGAWGAPVNLGAPVNQIGGICPTVTADGRYLMFNGANDDNFWVDAELIERLRP